MSNLRQNEEAKKSTISYMHQVNKSKIPTCNILGVNIAVLDIKWLIQYINKNIKRLSGDYICVSNVHTTIMSSENPKYCEIQNGGIMAIPDGGPLSAVANKRGYTQMKRVTGPTLMGKVFIDSEMRNYRHYFYGSTEETLKMLYQELTKAYSHIQIAGMYSPPFRPMTEEEDEIIIKQINDTKPDIVWIGLGAPKQEIWMANHQGKIKGLMIGVGAGFDYYAGNISRAPEWMQKHSLEWLYRLMQDPKRLFKRYMVTNIKFIWKAIIRGK